MKSRQFCFILIYVIVIFGSCEAQAYTVNIDFDDNTSLDDLVPVYGIKAIENYYSSLGVVFIDTSWVKYSDSWPLFSEGTSGGFGIKHTFDEDGRPITNYPTETNPHILLFDVPVVEVSIVASSVGIAGVRMVAYSDSSGSNSVGYDEYIGESYGLEGSHVKILNVSGDIQRVEIYQAYRINGDGLVLDDLSFTVATAPVPLPAAAYLLTAGLGGLGLLKRKRG